MRPGAGNLPAIARPQPRKSIACSSRVPEARNTRQPAPVVAAGKDHTVTTQRNRIVAEHSGDMDVTDGDWGTQFPFSQPGDWVSLANISHGAKALYTVYCGHLNKKKNGNACWPSQLTLANILGVQDKTIRKWIKELESIGAIVITEIIDPRTGYKRLYAEVNQAAPDGYDGYVDYESYYKDQRDLRKTMKPTLKDTAAAKESRQPPVKNTDGLPAKSTGGPDQAKQEPPVKSTEGQGSKSTAGLPAKSTDEEDETKKTKERTHTPAAAETPQPDTNDSVCEPTTKPKTPTDVHDGHLSAAWHLLRAVVPAAAATRMQEDQREDLVARVARAIANGWTSALLTPRLNGTVNENTEFPYGLLRKRLGEITHNNPPQTAVAATPKGWGTPPTTGATDDPTAVVEAAPGVRLLPDGTKQIRYRSCGDRHCTGGSGAGRGTGTYRRRIDPDTGAADEYCDNPVALSDGRMTTCHPDARKEHATQ